MLGTRDYVRKCGFSKVYIGLSGGIDSALVAAVAVDALGKENVTGVGMPSQYSSAGSLDDARALAANLGMPLQRSPSANCLQDIALPWSRISPAGSRISPRKIFSRGFAAIC